MQVGYLVDVRVHVDEVEIVDRAGRQLEALLPAALAVVTHERIVVFGKGRLLHVVHVIILWVLWLKICTG